MTDTGESEGLQAQRLKHRGIFALEALTLACAGLTLLVPEPTARTAGIATFILASIVLAVSILLSSVATRQLTVQHSEMRAAHATGRQIEELFAMTDMLQAADGHDDAGSVLRATSERLLDEFSGALYVFNNSRDRLDLAAKWGEFDDFTHPEILMPNACWALKRGKPHINDPASRTLCCDHHRTKYGSVEIPMMARNELHGLLVFATHEDNAFERLIGIRRLARALADSMSLALSNIELRDKLRTQSLRDPLTGLYNRRYMEDALERYISLAERSGSSTALVMLDLDNFKLINDEFGHAKGDAVLRDVAAQLVSSLRPSDVVARFGGEELTVIMPNCSLDSALMKCENLRERIESLSEAHGARISASFGIAAIPETSTGPGDGMAMADAALYEAKAAGKNRIHCAERRAGRADALPRVAAA